MGCGQYRTSFIWFVNLRKDLGSDINASRPLHAAKPLNSSGPMLRVRGWDAAAVGWGWGWAVLHPSNKVAWSVWAKKKVSVSRQCAVRPVELCWYKSFGAQVILSAQTAWPGICLAGFRLTAPTSALPDPPVLPHWKRGQEMFDWGKKCNVKYLALTKAVWGLVCCMQVYILLVHCLDKWYVLPEMSARFLGFLCSSCISNFFAVHLLVQGEENGNTTA